MSYTDAELAALKRAYASGVLKVEYDGTRTEYDSGAALLARIRVIEADIASAAGAPRNMSTFATFNRG